MRFLSASVGLGFFSWLSYMVLTGRAGDGVEDGSNLHKLVEVLDRMVEALGVNQAAMVILGVGALVAFAIIAFGPRAEDA